MRQFINAVEAYSRENSELLKYMQQKDFDPYIHWWYVCRWLDENDYIKTLSELIGEPIENATDLNDHEPEVFFKLPPEVQKECAEEVMQEVMQSDPADAPTWAHMDTNSNKLLHNQTWLVHFSDNAREISRYGFKYGIDEMDKLGLTTWFKDEAKKYGGYNFAFKATSRYALTMANKALSGRGYGRHAVLFRNSGVDAHHYGDEEDQVIFWGTDVKPSDIIYLMNDGDEWSVMKKWRSGHVFVGNFEACVKWVMQNWFQYRKVI